MWTNVNHPNISKLLGIAPEDKKYNLIFEFVEGYNLREIVFSRALLLTTQDKLHIMRKMCNVVNYLHRPYLGKPTIVHGDIKPDNVLIDKVKHNWLFIVKVCDFGLSKSKGYDSGVKSTNPSIAGTWSYMAPEQIIYYEQPSTKTDIWSLGRTFEEL